MLTAALASIPGRASRRRADVVKIRHRVRMDWLDGRVRRGGLEVIDLMRPGYRFQLGSRSSLNVVLMPVDAQGAGPGSSQTRRHPSSLCRFHASAYSAELLNARQPLSRLSQ